ncbi:MAG: hypothetical protein NC904_08455, partial [Candidatus Omnitrophica bacterium]|nr:hypothetical protein [Candidatus Omnitrophota bacterium]
IILSLPLVKNHAPVAFFGPRGMDKTSTVESSSRLMAILYDMPVVLITWNFGGATADSNIMEYIIQNKIGGKKYARIEVALKDVVVNIYHPDGRVEKTSLYNILPEAEKYLKDKYITFFLDDFTKLHPHKQGRFLEFFRNFRIGNYDFKELAKGVNIIISGYFKTKSEYVYDLLDFITDKIYAFSVYTPNEFIDKLAEGEVERDLENMIIFLEQKPELKQRIQKIISEKEPLFEWGEAWHPALIAYIDYEKFNTSNHLEKDYTSARTLEAVSITLHKLDMMEEINKEAGKKIFDLSDKVILLSIASAVKGTADEELKLALKNRANEELLSIAKLMKVYYDAYRISKNLIKIIQEEGRLPNEIYRPIEADVNEKKDANYALKNIISTIITSKINNLPPIGKPLEEQERFIKLVHEAIFNLDVNMTKEELDKAYPLFRKYFDEAIKDYRKEYEKVVDIIIQLFGLDEKRMGERYIKDFDSGVKVYYDEQTLKVTEIQTIRGEEINDKTYKLENGEIVEIGKELPQRLKDIKATVENYALSQLTVVYGLKKLGEKLKGNVLGAYTEFALAVVFTEKYGRRIDEVTALKLKDEDINITKEDLIKQVVFEGATSVKEALN